MGTIARNTFLLSTRWCVDPWTIGDEDEAIILATRATRSICLDLPCFGHGGPRRYGTTIAPTLSQMQDALAFGRAVIDGHHFFDGPKSDPLIVVRCEMGRSRSSAIALALLADHFGAGRERDAVNELLRADIEARMHPNPMVVLHADTCLLRCGRLDAALAASNPRYLLWRRHWTQAALDPIGHAQLQSRIRYRRKQRSG